MQELIKQLGGLTVEQVLAIAASLAAVVAAIWALFGKILAAFGWLLRWGKPKPVAPTRVIIDVPEPPPPAPESPLGIIGVPPGRTVVGREKEIAYLRRALLAGGRAGGASGSSGVVLKGEGGRGKSTLARSYAEVHGGEYHGGLWMHAGTRQAVIEGLTALCAPLGVDVPDTPQVQHAQAVLRKVEASGKGWLFVYDNVEGFGDIKGLVPRGAHLIVTTRQGEGWPGWEVINTDVLGFATNDAPAVVLLKQEAGRWDQAAEARALAEELGGLPLALVVAGALIEATGEGFAAYAERLDEVMKHVPKNEEYPTSLIGAVQLSYDKLEGDDARMVADLCAWWAAEGLAPALLTEAPQGDWWEGYRAKIPEPVQALTADAGRVRAAFGALAERSLITGEGGAWTMHRMTARALRALQAARGDTAPAEAAAALLDSVYPGDNGPAHSPQWPLCARLTPHVRALWATGAAPHDATMESPLNQSGIYLDAIADYPGAAEMVRASWKLSTARLPEKDRDLSVAEGNLGAALLRLGDLAAAEAHLARAVALNEAHRPDSADLAESYSLHGSVLLGQARAGATALLPQAARRYQRALALRRRLFGRDSERVAQALSNLGSVRNDQGRTAAAARLWGASLRIYRAVLPPEDARLGYGLLGTGAMWLKSGAADRAEPLLREALDLRQAVYAAQPRHPDTRDAAEWLIACLLVRTRAGEDAGTREAEARRLCDRYGFDFADREAMARRYPYTPGA